MVADMFHQNKIARAIRLLCQGATALSADVDGGDELTVGSNELFEVGQQVRLVDTAGSEELTVAGLVGLTTVRLTGAVSGEYLTSRGARLEVVDGSLPELRWVGQGSPELLPGIAPESFPCALVLPTTMEQPLNRGSNRTFQQDYRFEVYYVREHGEGEAANVEVVDEAGKLFNLLMSDPYLGGTCWHSQVVEVNARPDVQERMREREWPLRVVRMTMLARRVAVWQ